MDKFCDAWKRASAAAFLAGAVLLAFGCATAPPTARELPPLLAHDELLRPCNRVASIEVRRERYGYPSDYAPADYDWAYQALREEAAKMGADAVTTPEVKIQLKRYLFFPTSQITAKGIAVKFQ